MTAPTLQGPEGLLAHYTSAEVAFEKVLVPDGKLRLSRYGDMNDPAEAEDLRVGMGFYGDGKEHDGFATFGAMLETVSEIRNSRRLLCLTQDVPGSDNTFGCCWARPRMWEQYGDHHRGACLVFDAGKLRNALKAQVPPQTTQYEPTLHTGAVKYTPGGIADSMSVGMISDEDLFSDVRLAVARHIDRHYHDFYFLKTDDWASEYEYRCLITSATEEPHAFVDYRDALVAVIVGFRFPEYQLLGARAMAETRGVELRRLWWEGGTPFALGAGRE